MFDQIGLDFVFIEHCRRVAWAEALGWQEPLCPLRLTLRLRLAYLLIALAGWLAPSTRQALTGKTAS